MNEAFLHSGRLINTKAKGLTTKLSNTEFIQAFVIKVVSKVF